MSRPTASSARRTAAPSSTYRPWGYPTTAPPVPRDTSSASSVRARRVEALDPEDRSVEVLVEQDRHRVEDLAVPLHRRAAAGDHMGVGEHEVVLDHDPGALQDPIASGSGDEHHRRARRPSRPRGEPLSRLWHRVRRKRREAREHVREPDDVEHVPDLRGERRRWRKHGVHDPDDGRALQGAGDRRERARRQVDAEEPDGQDERDHREGATAHRVRGLEPRSVRSPPELDPEDRGRRIAERAEEQDRPECHGRLGRVGPDEPGGEGRDPDADDEPDAQSDEPRHLEYGAASIAAPRRQREQYRRTTSRTVTDPHRPTATRRAVAVDASRRPLHCRRGHDRPHLRSARRFPPLRAEPPASSDRGDQRARSRPR